MATDQKQENLAAQLTSYADRVAVLVLALPRGGVPVAFEVAKELRAPRRERAYRGDRPEPDVRGKTIILVDDGLATGSTMRAAAAALRQQDPARIIVGVPVSDNYKASAVVINVGKTPADHVSHKIDHPVHIWLQQTEAGADAALEIEAEDDSKTLLRFCSPTLPEFVDGVVLD